ncbi:hypothetical protein [Chitinophaga sp. Cy-1792]|uniref:hypothetical protein n=1 Tax=Chitinophaga sp. Cy-1792 TaxID=2608339 RepID=UPI00142145D3|nr:hypothetical protein [Chitinophaga sp. Cy-1792]NIG56459.1 hypothetical protein [Chitinophaga sp. Cy-1792]
MTTRQILFHHLKHHLFSVRHFIQSSLPTDNKLHTIKTFGGSQFDIYTGPLQTETITQEVLHYLIRQDLSNRDAFENWVNTNGGFRTITLSDNSSWTLRIQPAIADAAAPFVHLHPSRYSPNTLRIKANAMKSIVVYYLLATDTTILNFTVLNVLREKHLDLSPIDPAGNTEELQKVFALLSA